MENWTVDGVYDRWIMDDEDRTVYVIPSLELCSHMVRAHLSIFRFEDDENTTEELEWCTTSFRVRCETFDHHRVPSHILDCGVEMKKYDLAYTIKVAVFEIDRILSYYTKLNIFRMCGKWSIEKETVIGEERNSTDYEENFISDSIQDVFNPDDNEFKIICNNYRNLLGILLNGKLFYYNRSRNSDTTVRLDGIEYHFDIHRAKNPLYLTVFDRNMQRIRYPL